MADECSGDGNDAPPTPRSPAARPQPGLAVSSPSNTQMDDPRKRSYAYAISGAIFGADASAATALRRRPMSAVEPLRAPPTPTPPPPAHPTPILLTTESLPSSPTPDSSIRSPPSRSPSTSRRRVLGLPSFRKRRDSEASARSSDTAPASPATQNKPCQLADVKSMLNTGISVTSMSSDEADNVNNDSDTNANADLSLPKFHNADDDDPDNNNNAFSDAAAEAAATTTTAITDVVAPEVASFLATGAAVSSDETDATSPLVTLKGASNEALAIPINNLPPGEHTMSIQSYSKEPYAARRASLVSRTISPPQHRSSFDGLLLPEEAIPQSPQSDPTPRRRPRPLEESSGSDFAHSIYDSFDQAKTGFSSRSSGSNTSSLSGAAVISTVKATVPHSSNSSGGGSGGSGSSKDGVVLVSSAKVRRVSLCTTSTLPSSFMAASASSSPDISAGDSRTHMSSKSLKAGSSSSSDMPPVRRTDSATLPSGGGSTVSIGGSATTVVRQPIAIDPRLRKSSTPHSMASSSGASSPLRTAATAAAAVGGAGGLQKAVTRRSAAPRSATFVQAAKPERAMGFESLEDPTPEVIEAVVALQDTNVEPFMEEAEALRRASAEMVVAVARKQPNSAHARPLSSSSPNLRSRVILSDLKRTQSDEDVFVVGATAGLVDTDADDDDYVVERSNRSPGAIRVHHQVLISANAAEQLRLANKAPSLTSIPDVIDGAGTIISEPGLSLLASHQAGHDDDDGGSEVDVGSGVNSSGASKKEGSVVSRTYSGYDKMMRARANTVSSVATLEAASALPRPPISPMARGNAHMSQPHLYTSHSSSSVPVTPPPATSVVLGRVPGRCSESSASSSPKNLFKIRSRVMSWSTTNQQSQKAAHQYNLDHSLLRGDVLRVWQRDIHEQPVAIDLPRLLRSISLVSRRGRDATIGEEVFARESEEARMAALSNAYRVVPLRHFFYVSLKHMVGDKERIDACLKRFDSAFAEFVRAESIEHDDIVGALKAMMKDNPELEGDSPVGGALRAMNQSSVAPFVTRLKGGLGSQLAWSSVPGQWRITVTIDVDAVYVDHQMSEEVIEATEDLDNSTVCTFEWTICIKFTADMQRLVDVGFDVTSVGFNPTLPADRIKKMTKLFNKYGYFPERRVGLGVTRAQYRRARKNLARKDSEETTV